MAAAEQQPSAADAPKSSKKKDALRDIELAMQSEWEANKLFETDAPENGKAQSSDTYFATFPFPYMNGRLHLGHAYTIMKSDFMIGYQRLKGKKTLFPFGFHCTGMPIKACADKLAKEMAQYGTPPVFPLETGPAVASKHAKIQAKTGNITRQWNIMQSLGIPDEEIPQFADADFWLEYFPPKSIADLRDVGAKVDWRRSFVTTPVNPYFDSFVRWQMDHLKAKNKIKFGKRLTIYSPLDGQPCMDHDRSSGEGVGPQEYTIIKLRMLEPLPECLKACEGKEVFLLAGTLRPETMYGQTNCWVHPDIKYIAYKASDSQVFVTTRRAARNMSYQDILPEYGVVEHIADVEGKDLFGCALSAPLAEYERVYALPMMTIKEGKGTGIVTSVPSDAPDDWAALRDVQKKEALRTKYGITDDMCLPFKPVPIIDIPGLGNLAAVTLCEEKRIQSQNDRDRLAEVKEEVYKRGYYDGIMIKGECAGQKVQDAKTQVQDSLIAKGLAFKYNEPEKKVMSRSGEECVVALCDQWFLDYGEENWRKQADKVLEKMECFDPQTRKMFERTLDWLHEHACSRTYGLGSRLPWDESWLIESLSDSTIYMAYYTVCHLLHGGSLDGRAGSPINVKAEQLTGAVWDYIFLGTQYPKGCTIPEKTLAKLRNEFLYFYPVDLRVSGKDLVGNHLTYWLYNHCAMFPEEHWPRGVRANGHLQINSEKMSKSTGNFLTLSDAIDQFGADATRLTLAAAGDSLEDANFELATANRTVLNLYNELEWIETTLKGLGSLRTGALSTLADKIFLNDINVAITKTGVAYDQMEFREALKFGYYELQSARDFYRDVCTKGELNLHRDLTVHFIQVQTILLAPICPHFCEHVWKMLKKGRTDSVTVAPFPSAAEEDTQLTRSGTYLKDIMHTIRLRMQAGGKKGKKKKGAEPAAKPTKLTLYVSRQYPEWQHIVLDYLAASRDAETGDFPEKATILETLKSKPEVQPHMKMLMKFVGFVIKEVGERGAVALETTVPFDEVAVLKENAVYIARDLKLENVEVALSEEAQDAKVKQDASPGKPGVVFT